MNKANEKQIGGNHYRNRGEIQHWDFAASRKYDYFQGAITKYVDRWRDKAGIQDLEKALHYLEKYIEVEKAKLDNKVQRIDIHEDRLAGVPRAPYIHPMDRETGQRHPFGYEPAKDI